MDLTRTCTGLMSHRGGIYTFPLTVLRRFLLILGRMTLEAWTFKVVIFRLWFNVALTHQVMSYRDSKPEK